jgi:hypothetical protein
MTAAERPTSGGPSAAETARRRVQDVDAWADAKDVVSVLKSNPSLRGIVMGYVAEDRFEILVLSRLAGATRIRKDDDHKKSKSDRRFVHGGREYTVQLKSIQTNSIRDKDGMVVAVVQNDASDKRKLSLPSGKTIETTCYAVGEYDILAVPLYPFTGKWSDFAYKRNLDLSRSRFKGYSLEDRACLLATTERITWPLGTEWRTSLVELLDETIGTPVDETGAALLQTTLTNDSEGPAKVS